MTGGEVVVSASSGRIVLSIEGPEATVGEVVMDPSEAAMLAADVAVCLSEVVQP